MLIPQSGAHTGWGIEIFEKIPLTNPLSRVALDTLDVAAADLQLQAGAAVPQAVKDHRTEVVLPNQRFQLLRDGVLLKGAAGVLGDHQIEVLISAAELGLQILLIELHLL